MVLNRTPEQIGLNLVKSSHFLFSTLIEDFNKSYFSSILELEFMIRGLVLSQHLMFAPIGLQPSMLNLIGQSSNYLIIYSIILCFKWFNCNGIKMFIFIQLQMISILKWKQC